VNPELVLQGTGTSHAVIDEEDFPISDVDSEELDSFYDTVRVSGDVSALIGCATSLSSAPGVALCSVSGDLVGHGHSTATAYPRGRMLVLSFDLLVKCRRCDRRQSN